LNRVLKSLASNGGPTQTHALLADSPAVGFAALGFGITVDQRSVGRDALPDTGSFEYSETIDGLACFVTKAANGSVITFCL